MLVFSFGVCGFFKSDEVLQITYGDIVFHIGYVATKVDKSKTDQLRKGNEAYLFLRVRFWLPCQDFEALLK